jgi:hypothetical protein
MIKRPGYAALTVLTLGVGTLASADLYEIYNTVHSDQIGTYWLTRRDAEMPIPPDSHNDAPDYVHLALDRGTVGTTATATGTPYGYIGPRR